MRAWLVKSVAILAVASMVALSPRSAACANRYGDIDLSSTNDAVTGIAIGVSVAVAALVGGLVWYFVLREDEPEVRSDPEPVAPVSLSDPAAESRP